MCITIPSSARTDRKLTPGSRFWAWLIDKPLRLFSGAGLFFLALLLLSGAVKLPSDPLWLRFDLMFGIAPFLVFGLLLQVYPQWLGATPVRYARYGLVFFLLSAAQLLFFVAAWLTDGPGWLYLFTLLVAWWLMFTTLTGLSRLRALGPDNQETWVNYALLVGMAALLLAGAGLLANGLRMVHCAFWFGLAGFLIPASLLIVLNHLSYTQSRLQYR